MKGELVVVRSFGGGAATMRVWRESESYVSLVPTDEFERLAAGKSELQPVGFLRSDVFRHDSENPPKLIDLDWGTMTPY